MLAAVYRGKNRVKVESIPIPSIHPGEVLVRVDSCGVCGSDLKKIELGTMVPPLVFGHEIAGVIVKVGKGVRKWVRGDRVAVFHHVPCRKCYFCDHGDYAQCAVYRKVGTTAGFDPAGGGFAQYVRVLPWIVRAGMVRLPRRVTFEEASFLEPLNTCVKGMQRLDISRGDQVLVFGQGPIGLIFTQLIRLKGGWAWGLDLLPARRRLGKKLGAMRVENPVSGKFEAGVKKATQGRGADAAIMTVSSEAALGQALRCVRPGGKVLLFAHTQRNDPARVDAGAICVDEKTLLGSYSASIDVQEEVNRLVFGKKIRLAPLVSHRFSISQATKAFRLATHPTGDSLKILIKPWEGIPIVD